MSRAFDGDVELSARAREELAAGEIDKEFMNIVASSAPSVGHCNTMGTASTMNSLAEPLGMSLPGLCCDPRALPRARPAAKLIHAHDAL